MSVLGPYRELSDYLGEVIKEQRSILCLIPLGIRRANGNDAYDPLLPTNTGHGNRSLASHRRKQRSHFLGPQNARNSIPPR